MVGKREKAQETRTVAKVSGLGLAVFLLTSLASAWAQQGTVAPALPAEAASKEPTTPVASPDAQKTPLNDYTVSPEDLLDVSVMDVPEVTRTYRVSSNGFLSLPLLPEPIPAAGESLDQLGHLIATKFHDAGMINNAQVTVTLRETRLHTVLVSGEVKRPQSYPIFGPTRLLDVLIQAGGLAETAGNNVIITRGDIGARAELEESARSSAVNTPAPGQSFTLNIRKLVTTGDDKTNVLLYPGDRVTVQRAPLIYVMGAVARPGGYVLNEANQQVTVLKALAMAGDLTNVAKKSHITLLRRDPAGPGQQRDEIPCNYNAMMKGQVADVRLQAEDILYVPESASLKAWRTTVNSAVSVASSGATGLMIYR
ncbi:MAG TPA: polysaccharide biosynthesis/export family protein [Terriglobia bacterium]|nr:polysaccharide biosynthesis/export family protein [Terriglobia bacterium]